MGACYGREMDLVQTQKGSAQAIDLEDRYGAHNYHPLPVVIARGEGVWVFDTEDNAYFDGLSAYSALNFGHCHPRLVEAATRQLGRLTLTSRAFHNELLGAFCRELAQLCGKDRVLPMNTGAEGVETAIKTARKWGYERKGVAADRARIVVCAGNFHGRTTTIVSFSDDPLARDGFGPFAPGFDIVPYGDLAALEAAITPDTVGFLIEPVQGEAGVVSPPEGFLRAASELCREHRVLFIADEIQSGLGRTGRTFAVQREDVVPDVLILGKALGGGILPLSAVVADDDVLGVFRPGEHGSTFGGNPLACAVGLEVIRMLEPGTIQAEAARNGDRLGSALRSAGSPAVTEIRQVGLWIGIDVAPEAGTARSICEELMRRGVLCKDTHEQTVRFAPPLTATASELDWALERILAVLG
jgi:ornithine--oxo-acid transaminase